MFDLLSLNTIQKITKFMVMLAVLNVLLITTQVLILSKFQTTPNEVKADVLINRGIELSNAEKLDKIIERLNGNLKALEDPN